MPSLLEDIKKQMRAKKQQAVNEQVEDTLVEDKDGNKSEIDAANSKMTGGSLVGKDILPTGGKKVTGSGEKDKTNDEIDTDNNKKKFAAVKEIPLPEEVEEEEDAEVIAESEDEQIEDESTKEEISETIEPTLDASEYKLSADDIDSTEDLNAIFGEDAEGLSEEFKARVKSIFEAAVVAKVNEKVEALTEAANQVIAESREEIYEEVAEGVDRYIEMKVLPEWLEENKVAIAGNVKLQVMESFMTGLKALFEDHYIEMPEDKEDILESVVDAAEQMEADLNAEIEKNTALAEEVEKLKKQMLVSESLTGLSANQAEKFKLLAEGVEYTDDETFVAKISELKEAYFAPKAPAKPAEDTEVVLNEDNRRTGRSSQADVVASTISKMFGKN